MSIINYFEKTLAWDLFLQGFFLISVLLLAFLLLIYMMPHYHQKDESFFNFFLRNTQNKLNTFFLLSNEIIDHSKKKTPADETSNNDFITKLPTIVQFLSLGPIIIIISFIAGVICSEISDLFMDSNNKIHLGLKKNWLVDKEDSSSETDKQLKKNTFYKVFGDDVFNNNNDIFTLFASSTSLKKKDETLKEYIILQIYYEGKHQILSSNVWRDYLSYSQNLVNLNQTLCFGSWILLITSILSFTIAIVLKYKREIMNIRTKLSEIHLSNHQSNRKYRIYKNHEKKVLLELIISLSFIILFIANIFLDIRFKGFSIGFLCLYFTLFLIFISIRYIRGHRINTPILFIFFSLVLYHLTAIAWKGAEKETNSKTFGLIKHLNKEYNGKNLQIFFKPSFNKDTTQKK